MTRTDTTPAPTLRSHGITIPAIGLGTSGLDDDTAAEVVAAALEMGYRHVDTAIDYDNEVGVGRGLRTAGLDRDDVFVTTKVPPGDAAGSDVGPAVEASLERLGLDHVDLLLLHWPNVDVDVEETVAALDAVRERGLTRSIGISNHPVALMRRAAAAGPVMTNQVEYHPYLAQDAVLAAARELDLTITAYSPLAQGEVFDDDVLADVAAAHDATAGQVALRWLLDQDGVAVIPRSSNLDHVAANLAVDVTLSDDDRGRIDALRKDRRLIDPASGPDWD